MPKEVDVSRFITDDPLEDKIYKIPVIPLMFLNEKEKNPLKFSGIRDPYPYGGSYYVNISIKGNAGKAKEIAMHIVHSCRDPRAPEMSNLFL